MEDLSWRQALSLVLTSASITQLFRFFRIFPYSFLHPGSPYLVDFVVAESLLFVGACVAGLAAWCIWKEVPSARAWAVAGSLVLVMISLRQFAHNAFFPRRPLDYELLALPGVIFGITITIIWPKPNPSGRNRILDWLHRGEDPPSMFDHGKKNS